VFAGPLRREKGARGLPLRCQRTSAGSPDAGNVDAITPAASACCASNCIPSGFSHAAPKKYSAMSPRFMLLSAASDARVRWEGDARVVQRGSAVRAARPPRARVGKRSRLLETVEHAVFMVTLKLCESLYCLGYRYLPIQTSR
jgi:hypothetical protein